MRAFVLSAALACVACGALVGIRDVEDEPTSGGGPDSGSGPDAASSPADAGDGGDAGGERDASIETDAGADADADAAPTDTTITGGAAHFLAAGDALALAYTGAGGAKTFAVSANGPFELPEPASAVTIASAPAGRECWARPSRVEARRVDVGCVVVARAVVPPRTLTSTSYIPVPGSELTVVTDLPSTHLLLVYSMPFLTTTGRGARAKFEGRIIVDGDESKTIDTTRQSEFFAMPWNQTALGVLEVGPGTHSVRVEARSTSESVLLGGTFVATDSHTFRTELAAVALESLRGFTHTATQGLAANQTFAKDEDAWRPIGGALSGVGTGTALVLAHYPEAFITSGVAPSTALFSLRSGTTPIASADFVHIQDSPQSRAAAVFTTTPIDGAYTFSVEHRTVLGPNTLFRRNGAALAVVGFDRDAAVQSWSFNETLAYPGQVGIWQPVLSTKKAVSTRSRRALVLASISRITNSADSGAFEAGIFDGARLLASAVGQSWYPDYSQPVTFATIADLSSSGPHELELRVRNYFDYSSLTVNHATVPDGRGSSSISVVPLD